MAKFGNIKRQHGRIEGLDELLDWLVASCPHVSRIIPGRMGRKHGRTLAKLKVQYATAGAGGQPCGLKCIYTRAGSWQEVFLVCDDAQAAQEWLERAAKKGRLGPGD